jgi:arylsulfatase
VDIMATCCDVAGVQYPSELDGRAIIPAAGESFGPTLRGQQQDTSDRLVFWEHEGNCAVRHGRWKLVQKFETAGQWELYDMVEDRTELTDLAESKWDEADRLEAIYTQWADSVGVIDRQRLIDENWGGKK